jgi:integrase
VLKVALGTSRTGARPATDPDLTVRTYAERWLRLQAASVKPRSHEIYESTFRLHVLPGLADVTLAALSRQRLRVWLTEKLEAGLARGTVGLMLRVFGVMLQAAVEEDVLDRNPAHGLGKTLKLGAPRRATGQTIPALDREALAAFLSAAAGVVAFDVWVCLLLLARTGMRVGEALGLQWPDVNLRDREIRISRTMRTRQTGSPKSGLSRTVDVSQELAQALRRLQVQRTAETLQRGGAVGPAWVFCAADGRAWRHEWVERSFKRAAKAAGLPASLSPHALRHTYASLLLQQGESPVYVQRQLGHASITITVDLYGSWLPMGSKAAVDRLDARANGSKTVAAAAQVPETYALATDIK